MSLHTTVLLLVWNMSGSTRVSRYQKGKTRKVKTNLDLMSLTTSIKSLKGILELSANDSVIHRGPQNVYPNNSVKNEPILIFFWYME